MAQLSTVRIRTYLARGDSATTTKDKGDALEDLIVLTRAEIEALADTNGIVLLFKTKLRQLAASGTIF